ncbi:hypothetical protein PO002_46445, partial [Cupriavidus necator]|uniref:hypothetical protein n=1 Tax=Cupriavidus necator TaxID=106590 RepID=UPI0039C44DDD
ARPDISLQPILSKPDVGFTLQTGARSYKEPKSASPERLAIKEAALVVRAAVLSVSMGSAVRACYAR